MAGEGGAVAWPLRGGKDADHDLVVVELLERDVRRGPERHPDLLAEARPDLARGDRRRQPPAQLRPPGRAKGSAAAPWGAERGGTRRERPAEGQRARGEPGDPQSDGGREQDRPEADQEADGAGRRRIEAAKELGGDPA